MSTRPRHRAGRARRARHRAGRDGHTARTVAPGVLIGAAGIVVATSGFGVFAADQVEQPGVQAQLATGETTQPPFSVEPPIRLGKANPPGPSRAAVPAAAAGVPVRLVVPTLGVDAPVVAIPAADGVLLPPDDPQTLGWWSGGARPGARHGSALVTGHTVHSGGGAFDDLETLEAGDVVRVRTARGPLRYVVRRVALYGKASLAADAGRVFSQAVPGRLVLVTCEDWNGEVYLSNVVVVADPVTRP